MDRILLSLFLIAFVSLTLFDFRGVLKKYLNFEVSNVFLFFLSLLAFFFYLIVLIDWLFFVNIIFVMFFILSTLFLFTRDRKTIYVLVAILFILLPPVYLFISWGFAEILGGATLYLLVIGMGRDLFYEKIFG